MKRNNGKVRSGAIVSYREHPGFWKVLSWTELNRAICSSSSLLLDHPFITYRHGSLGPPCIYFCLCVGMHVCLCVHMHACECVCKLIKLLETHFRRSLGKFDYKRTYYDNIPKLGKSIQALIGSKQFHETTLIHSFCFHSFKYSSHRTEHHLVHQAVLEIQSWSRHDLYPH